MPVSTTQEDLLPHIQYQNKQPASPTGAGGAGGAGNLADQVASPSGRIVIVSAFGCSLVLTYQFTGSAVVISIILETPVGSATLGSATIDPNNPCITIGGSVGGFKAEAKICYNFSTHILSFDAQVCAPFLGCKSASGSLHL